MTKTNKEIFRRCYLTYQILPKNALIRVVRLPDQSILVNSYLPGRGVYFAKNAGDPTKIWQKKLLHKAFRQNVSAAVYQELLTILKGGESEKGQT
ncbi:YlxR family protein [Mycoplasma sp. ATU-Cv-703]|uniref:DUF448 domain-containing protein n=1 Tax=Mycoplasma sp. ATU-Cv-703 TaxID=2498595 RepID=UPI000FDF61B4